MVVRIALKSPFLTPYFFWAGTRCQCRSTDRSRRPTPSSTRRPPSRIRPGSRSVRALLRESPLNSAAIDAEFLLCSA
jgi:hypothetical protein